MIENKNEQDFIDAINLIVDFFAEVANGVKNIIKETVRLINEYRERKEHDYNWHVPIKIEPPKMPDIPVPRMLNIRSCI